MPRRIGAYEILGPVARGGAGAVFRARHRETGAVHAVKIVASSVEGEDGARAIARFRREAEILARLDAHPGIVGVHAVGVEGGRPWYAMDLVEGRTLQGTLEADGPMAAADAATLVAKIARAIAHAHRDGVVHRDLKPDNVLLDRARGEPRIVDFGLAFDAFADERLTRTGTFLGTPAFMAPEQVSRRSGSPSWPADEVTPGSGSGEGPVGPSADVYGLGAILYATLTGEPPFDPHRDPLRLAIDVLERRPVAPSRRGDGRPIPEAIDAVTLKALEKRPEDRYATALELAEDLERFIRGDEVTARTTGRLSSALYWWRARRMGWRATALLVGVAITVAAVGLAGLQSLAGPDGAAAIDDLIELEASFDRGGSFDAGQRRRLASLVVQAEGLGPGEARRAAVLDRVAALLDAPPGSETASETARALAALVRTDAAPNGEDARGPIADAVLAERVQRALGRAGRIAELHIILHGAEPAIPIRITWAAAVAQHAATDGAALAPVPLDQAAFDALYRAPGLDPAPAGRLRSRRAERLATLPDRADQALAEMLETQRRHGPLADMTRWPRAFREHAWSELAARLESQSQDPGPLVDLLVRAAVEDADAVPPVAVCARIQSFLVDASQAYGTGDDVSDALFSRLILAAAFLETIGHAPLTTASIRPVWRRASNDGKLARYLEEALRPGPRERNPAVLAILIRLYLSAETQEERDAFGPTVDRLIRAAAATELDRAWLHLQLGRATFERMRYGEAADLLALAYAIDRARPLEQRWPAIASDYALFLCYAADDDENVDLDLGFVTSIALDAARVQEAARPRLDALIAANGLHPWSLEYVRRVIGSLLSVADAAAFRSPRCCELDPGFEVLIDAATALDPDVVSSEHHRRVVANHQRKHGR